VTKNDLYNFVREKFSRTTFYGIPALRPVTAAAMISAPAWTGRRGLATPVFQVRTVRLTIHRRKAERWCEYLPASQGRYQRRQGKELCIGAERRYERAAFQVTTA